MYLKLIFLIFVSIILASCNTTNPTDVKKSDTQKITSIKYGNIVSSLPVKVKGEGSMLGTTTGALIGGLLGNYLNLKIFSSRILALVTSMLVIFVAMRMGYRIFI